jgi:hypothetical protein
MHRSSTPAVKHEWSFGFLTTHQRRRVFDGVDFCVVTAFGVVTAGFGVVTGVGVDVAACAGVVTAGIGDDAE